MRSGFLMDGNVLALKGFDWISMFGFGVVLWCIKSRYKNIDWFNLMDKVCNLIVLLIIN